MHLRSIILLQSWESYSNAQGINSITSPTLTPHYLPYYIFTYTTYNPSSGSTEYHQSVASYAGYHHRPALAELVHSETLIDSSSSSSAHPFSNRWLRYIYDPTCESVSSSEDLQSAYEVDLDPWSTHRSQCWGRTVKEDREIYGPSVTHNVIDSKRLVLPVWIVSYQLLGLPFRAAMSGCHSQPPPPGTAPGSVTPEMKGLVDHSLFGGAEPKDYVLNTLFPKSRDLYNPYSTTGNWAARILFGTVSFVLKRLPAFLIAGALGAGVKKVLYPFYLENKSWEEATKEKEEGRYDGGEWVNTDKRRHDVEGARRKFERGRKGLGGRREQQAEGRRRTEGGKEGEFNWRDFGEEFRKGFEQQQQQRQKQQQQQQQQQQNQQQNQERYRQGSSSRSKPSSNTSGGVKFPFDVNDPYAVLRVDRNVDKAGLQRAFRREILKWHPDRFMDEGESKKKEALERTKLVTNAYQQLRKTVK